MRWYKMKKIDHIGIAVKNLNDAVCFFQNTYEAELIWRKVLACNCKGSCSFKGFVRNLHQEGHQTVFRWAKIWIWCGKGHLTMLHGLFVSRSDSFLEIWNRFLKTGLSPKHTEKFKPPGIFFHWWLNVTCTVKELWLSEGVMIAFVPAG